MALLVLIQFLSQGHILGIFFLMLIHLADQSNFLSRFALHSSSEFNQFTHFMIEYFDFFSIIFIFILVSV